MKNTDDICNIQCIHEDVVKKVKETLLPDQIVKDLSQLYKVLGDNSRLSILHALLQSEMCVCDVAAVLNMTQSAVSHQLRTLKAARLVKYRREGKQVYYSLDDDHITELLKIGLEHIGHQ